MSRLIISIILLCVWCASVCAEQDWTGPAPAHEIERANKFMEMKFGPELYKYSIYLVSSGLDNIQGELSGYFMCYHFVPLNLRGTYAVMCIQRSLDGEYCHFLDGEIPDCANYPEWCEVNVGIAEALQIARENGFSAEARRTAIGLGMYPKYSAFVWRIDEKQENPDGGIDHERLTYFLINARTGEIERKVVLGEG